MTAVVVILISIALLLFAAAALGLPFLFVIGIVHFIGIQNDAVQSFDFGSVEKCDHNKPDIEAQIGQLRNSLF